MGEKITTRRNEHENCQLWKSRGFKSKSLMHIWRDAFSLPHVPYEALWKTAHNRHLVRPALGKCDHANRKVPLMEFVACNVVTVESLTVLLRELHITLPKETVSRIFEAADQPKDESGFALLKKLRQGKMSREMIVNREWLVRKVMEAMRREPQDFWELDDYEDENSSDTETWNREWESKCKDLTAE